MHRVMIIGCPGAGKSWLGKRVSQALGLPLVSLDAVFWEPGWVQPDPTVWLRRVEKMTAEQRWVMDGNYAGTLEVRMLRADAIIFLDLPRWQYMASLFRRTVFQLGRVREDMAPGCPERLDIGFFLHTWRYKATIKQIMLRSMRDLRPDQHGIVLRNRTEIHTFSKGLPSSLLNMEP